MKTLQELETLYAEAGLSAYFRAMKPHARNAIHMELSLCEEQDIPIGSSKIGGCPDLPKDTHWFYRDCGGERIPLSFLCQINFAEVKPFDEENILPEDGILYLFYDCDEEDGMPWGFDPQDGEGKRVFYYTGSLDNLERKTPPDGLDYYGRLFDACTLRFSSHAELPGIYSIYGEMIPLAHEDEDNYFALLESLDDGSQNKLLGHSDNMQGSMENECEYIAHGFSTCTSDEYESARAMGLDEDCLRWRLLLQLDSNEEARMMWGDCGLIYLWITEEDLKNRNFDHTWLILQCG